MRAAAPDPLDLRPIKWDVIVDGEGGRSQYGMMSRHAADRYARENRSRGRHVHVVQSGQ